MNSSPVQCMKKIERLHKLQTCTTNVAYSRRHLTSDPRNSSSTLLHSHSLSFSLTFFHSFSLDFCVCLTFHAQSVTKNYWLKISFPPQSREIEWNCASKVAIECVSRRITVPNQPESVDESPQKSSQDEYAKRAYHDEPARSLFDIFIRQLGVCRQPNKRQ